MTIGELGSLGEFIASIAVIISVLYLAYQIRAQRMDEKRRAALALYDQWNDAASNVDRESAELGLRAMRDFDGLDAADQMRAGLALTRLLKGHEALYYLYLDGALEADAWSTMNVSVRMTVKTPSFLEYWLPRQETFRPRFRELVEEHLASSSSRSLVDQYASSGDAKDASRD